MSKLFVVRFVILALACATLTGCFFFVIPGSVTSSISDAITGAHGSNCVATTVKVGDRVRMANGSIGMVKSLSGTSSRCTDAERPIRAEIVASTDRTPSQASSTYASKLRLNLSGDWTSQPLTDQQKNNGWSWYAANKNIDVGLLFRGATRNGITDMATYVETRRIEMKPQAADAALSEVSRIEVNGHPAFRYTITGTQANGQRVTVLVTFVDGSDEIAQLNTWTLAANFDHQRSVMEQLPENIVGF
jgi:hypothetical protein